MNDATCVRRDGRPVYVKKRGLCKPCYEADHRAGKLGDKVAPGPEPKGRKCSRDNCGKPHKAYGFCRPHLDEERSAGRQMSDAVRCTFTECPKPKAAEGLCLGHLRQKRAGKELKPLRIYRKRSGKCAGPECELDIHEHVGDIGYCSGHGFQAREGRELTVIQRENLKGAPCVAFENCGRFAQTRDGVCRPHSDRRRAGEPNWQSAVIPGKAPNGAGHLDKNGYRLIQHESRQRLEHCVFMEQLLGRPLDGLENVHHVNGHRADNRTDGPLVFRDGKLRSGNLELWSKKQPAGQEIGPKLEWAMEMQEEYEPYLTDEYLERMAAILERRS